MADDLVEAWAAMEAKSPVVEWKFRPRELKDDEVEIRVTHCGLCHTDVSQIDNDWNGSTYPMVPGHEIVGVVTKVGERVDGQRFYEGQRVGLGPQRDSCRFCKHCLTSDESVCPKPIWTYNSSFYDGTPTYGGYARFMRVYHKFLQPLPESIPSEYAPLLCAGITTYFPFIRHRELRPGSKVGIIGVGGLGHLALQYSSKMGHETIAISTSESKREEALSFGARGFLVSTPENLKKEGRTFDLLLSTASMADEIQKVDPYLNLLKPQGTFIAAGVHGLNLQASTLDMIFNRISIEGSNIGGTVDMAEMLHFSALHNIAPKIELLPFSRINEALDKVRKGTARYRMVVTHEPIA